MSGGIQFNEVTREFAGFGITCHAKLAIYSLALEKDYKNYYVKCPELFTVAERAEKKALTYPLHRKLHNPFPIN